MAKRPAIFHAHPLRPRDEANREYDQRRGSARARGYSVAWDRAARGHRRNHPLCAMCALDEKLTLADLVDHLYPHRGDTALFWDKRWWLSLCTTCHSGPKQALEHQGKPALDALARRLNLPVMAG